MLKGLKSLATGLLAGATLGLLFAPDKGENTRKKIQKEIKDGGSGMNSVKETIGGMGDDMKDTYKTVSERDDVKEATAKIKKYAKEAKNKSAKWIKENVPKEYQMEVKKTMKKAKTEVKKAKKAASKTIKKAKKKVDGIKKKTSAKKKTTKKK